jgi:hypothetical protein
MGNTSKTKGFDDLNDPESCLVREARRITSLRRVRRPSRIMASAYASSACGLGRLALGRPRVTPISAAPASAEVVSLSDERASIRRRSLLRSAREVAVPIPTKPPVYNGMIAPRDSWMMPPPVTR